MSIRHSRLRPRKESTQFPHLWSRLMSALEPLSEISEYEEEKRFSPPMAPSDSSIVTEGNRSQESTIRRKATTYERELARLAGYNNPSRFWGESPVLEHQRAENDVEVRSTTPWSLVGRKSSAHVLDNRNGEDHAESKTNGYFITANSQRAGDLDTSHILR